MEREVARRNGETFDWGLAKSVKGRGNIVVSGGLTPENVREAIEFFEPYGVDASSSLEEKPGKKSGERVRRFVRAAKVDSGYFGAFGGRYVPET